MVRSNPTLTPKRHFALFDQPYLLVSLTMLFWAGNTLVGRAMAGAIPPVALAQMRWTLACAILLPIALPHLRRDAAALRKHWKPLVLLGFLGITLYNTFLYVGVQTTTAVNAAMLNSLFPMVVAATAFAIYRDRLTPLQLGGILISCVGGAVILGRGSLSTFADFAFVAGDMWVMVSQLVYALYTVLLRERPAIHPLSFAAATIFLGQLLLMPLTIAEGVSGATVTFDLPTVASVLYVAIFPAVLAYLFFNRAVELIGANRTAPFFHLVPVFTSLGAMVLLGERIAPYHLVGWGLILAGIIATQVFRSRTATPR